ncbi:MAG: glycogen/starch/alpha-glucan phosphorylase [Richelia sp. RM2_1_2]|nr:glycogen/starch/alpha-glucan phosphorylase [Richelia sp. SM2_1_7]NJM20374.1 glycogen/starch/alpha-glucan phosphorylase [Richelia sp. SM1_7_0]NJN08520.1 glycogen/starch/alpha-glucan phosphorylase [Richelia sp. RM1_1_1]NJO28659.1 glycogen/starch/alpha-glucan phosphorylase [Richelia sp. SL_2_1]NJO60230.1 glycogen/starch/alpha-glucan phosphorylase [Richelia sp. RM2_1_2]
MSSSSSEPQYSNLAQENVPAPEIAKVRIEDDRTGMSEETLKRAIADSLYYVQGKGEFFATLHDYYMAVAHSVRDRILQRRIKTAETHMENRVKTVYYLSAEFLMGRYTGNSLINLGLYEKIKTVLKESGLELDDLLEKEREPGLGNGGLGRLAACYLDSLATLEIPAVGYGIRYEFGIFEQVIRNGWQVENPDKWLSFGNAWELPLPEYRVEVKFGGHTEVYDDRNGRYQSRWVPQQKVSGVPYDTPVPGYGVDTVNILRLWKAEATDEFDLQAFNAGDYIGAVGSQMFSENISKVLYPNDDTMQGKELRLQQQYFFVSCSLQDILRRHQHIFNTLDNLGEKAAIQLNDTHPSVGIAELMRLLIDEHQMSWDKAWNITKNTFAYTNHTLLPEALEKWPVALFGRLLPRHLEIIYEINFRFLAEVRRRYPGDLEKISRLSLIEEGDERKIRMAHLACVGSHKINGVAALHTELLKKDVLHDFYELFPEKFINKTNGVTPRRWLLLGNPRLARLITDKIGTDWIKNLDELRKLEKFIDDKDFRQNWRDIKQANKQELAKLIQKSNGITVDTNSLFDVQVKRLHEYKRQLLNAFHIITLYNQIKKNPQADILPRTFIFAGKAAPGYFIAKLIIKLINAVGSVVNSDTDVAGRLKVAFIPNYNVSSSQFIYAGAELSEQISTAGKEASGTGNMKFALNGALTIGTLDGANVEIREEVGEENFFLCGLTTPEVYELQAKGYNPRSYYESNPQLKEVIDLIACGQFSDGDRSLFNPLLDSLFNQDRFMLFADYQSYIETQAKVSQAYRDTENWTRMSILNSARMGKFSSDRAIWEYCQEIWNIQPCKVSLDEYSTDRAGLKIL